MKANELREDLAALSHEIWAHWMTYLFNVGYGDTEGQYVIPADKVQRWMRQMKTPYAELSEEEKASDREQADKIIKLLTNIEGGHQYSRELMALEKALTDPDVENAHSMADLQDDVFAAILVWAKMMEKYLG
jgi:hypothetical protein